MRRMVVAGIVLACAAFIAGGAMQGQRQAGVEAAPTRTATPVEVINFPAVQEVSGSVQVNNLPVDADGNLRVTGITPAPAFQFFKLADGLNVPRGPVLYLDPIPVGGWRRIQFMLDVKALTPAYNVSACVRFGGGGVFAGGVACAGTGQLGVFTATTEVFGPDAQFYFTTSDEITPAVVDLWVYLSN